MNRDEFPAQFANSIKYYCKFNEAFCFSARTRSTVQVSPVSMSSTDPSTLHSYTMSVLLLLYGVGFIFSMIQREHFVHHQ